MNSNCVLVKLEQVAILLLVLLVLVAVQIMAVVAGTLPELLLQLERPSSLQTLILYVLQEEMAVVVGQVLLQQLRKDGQVPCRRIVVDVFFFGNL
jgi:hypothetical protein